MKFLKLIASLVFFLLALGSVYVGTSLLATDPLPPSNRRVGPDSLFQIAQRFRVEAKLDSAEAVYLKADNLSKTQQDRTSSLRAAIGLTEIQIEKGEFQAAISRLEDLLKTDFDENQLDLKANIYCVKAESEIRYGNYAEADVSLMMCQNIVDGITPTPWSLEAYLEHLRGFLYHEQGFFMQALDHYQDALSIKQKVYGPDSVEYSNTLNNMGNVYYRIGLYDQSLTFHNATLTIRQNRLSETHPKVAGSYGNLGNIYDALGNAPKAIEHHEQAVRIWKMNYGETHPDLSFSFDNLGHNYNMLSKYEAAKEMYVKALEIKRLVFSSTHPALSTSLIGLGKALIGQESFTEATEQIEHALQLYELNHIDHHPKYITAKSLLAQAQYHQGLKSASFRSFDSAILKAKQTNKSTLIKLLNDYAIILNDDEQYGKSVELSQQALSVNLGSTTNSSLEFNPPVGSYYDLIEALRSMVTKAKSLRSQAAIHPDFQALLNVLKTYERALEIANYSRRHKASFDSINELNIDIELIAQGAISSALELYHIKPDRQFLDKIFQIVELQNSGHLIDDLTDSQAKKIAHVPDSLKKKEIDLRNELASFDRLLSQLDESDSEGDFAATIRYRRFLKRKLLDDEIAITERLYPRYYALKHGGIYANINDVTNHLISADEIAIQYFKSEKHLYALAFTRNKSLVVNLGSIEIIQELISSFVNVSTNEFTQLYFDKLHQLYAYLLQPILRAFSETKILIIPSNELNQVPFEALLTERVDVNLNPNRFARDFPFLIKTHQINLGYSATILLEQAKIKLPQFKSELLALGPVFDNQEEYSDQVTSFLNAISGSDAADGGNTKVEPLYGSLKELNDLAMIINAKSPWWKKFFNDPSEILLRSQVTEAGLKERDLTKYRFLHFATHSFAHQSNPVNSGILLDINEKTGEDGILYASEVLGLNIAAELVVLSSCETALDFDGGSTGISGFARGFIYAGAKNIIASLWPSDDTATRLLMRQFYLNLTSTNQISAALREAKIQLLTSDGPISHPYYWSGFVHIGSSAGSALNTDSYSAN